jgi:serine/threonine protein kinase
MSDVYEAVDQQDGAAVAVKLLRSADPELARRLAQEARALERLSHPGLVRLLDTGVVDSQAFLVMELVEGSTLANRMREGPLGAERTAGLGAALASALAYVHEQGIVHRDVKPSNIMVDAAGNAKLADFGIAQLTDASTLTVTGTTLGTAAYMAPEQLEHHQVGTGADVWSLGMVLLECLIGRRIYEGSPSEVVARRLAAPVPLPTDLPDPWSLLLASMLDHEPERRLDATDVAGLLVASPFRQEWAPSGDPEAETAYLVPDPTIAVPAPGSSTTPLLEPGGTRILPPPAAPPSRRGPRRPAVLAVLAVLALAALIIGLVIGLGSSPPKTPPLAATTTTTRAPTRSTTTTTIASAPNALAALVGDVASGQSAGSIDPGSAQAITSQAQMAESDASTGKSDQVAKDVQQVAKTIAMGLQHGKISAAEGATLQRDLAALAAVLGVVSAASPAAGD